jgi:hypothetical protein
MKTALVALVLAAASIGVSGEASRTVQTTPVPSWVRPVSAPSSARPVAAPAEGGSDYLLVDEQFDVASVSSYFHSVTKILDVASFEGGQNLSIGFDPAYQRLDVHYARLHRAGETIDLLRRQKFRVIQREENLESDLYDASLTALLLMEDLRTGDTLEYAYTLHGQNPVFGGRYMDSFAWQYGVPVQKRHASLRVPEGRRIEIWSRVPGLRADTVRLEGAREYRWTGVNLPAVEEEDDLPSWYEPYQEIIFSEFRSWKDVADWARDVYAPEARGDGGPGPLAERLRREHPDPEGYAAAALQFVQDEVRYYGVEMGEDSHRPTP